MKKAEKYTNKFPYEDLLPAIDEKEIQGIVNNCDYTIEANIIAEADDMIDAEVNTADAIVFFQMGYEAAKERLEEVLVPQGNI
jgi:hypothetical protein